MTDRLTILEAECENLRNRLTEQNALQKEIEALKEDLEISLDIHQKLQEVALAFEKENRAMQEKYNLQLKEKSKLNSDKIELQNELESKIHSYENLEKRFNKIREKVNASESLEDTIYQLEREKVKREEKIKDLEEIVKAHEQGSDMCKKDYDEKINKLTKENNDLTLKLETYIEEMEELDSKVETLETENIELKEQFNRLKNIEIVGSSIDTIQSLETQIKILEGKLRKEKQHKEIAENELFKIEEEYENYKISVEKNDRVSLLSSHDSLIVDNENEDEDLMVTVKRKQLIINNLDAERNELQSKIHTLEQEHEVLLDENSLLAKLNLQHEQRHREMLDERMKLEDEQQVIVKQLENQINNLQVKLNENDGGNVQIIQDKNLENEKLKNELKVSQDFLRIASDKNSELQRENDSLHEIFGQTKMSNEERNNIFNERGIQFDRERVDYERKLNEANAMIQELEGRIVTLKNFYESRSTIPSITTDASQSPEITPPVALKNGEYHDSMDEFREYSSVDGSARINNNNTFNNDTLDDRELRRIAYKIAEGDWESLVTELDISTHDAKKIRKETSNNQQIVYRLLVTWRSKVKLTRAELIKELCDHVNPKQKDVIRFLREMGGLTVREPSGVKSSFKKLRLSLKSK